MTQNNRYRSAHQAAVIADAVRKRQRSNQRDPPRLVFHPTLHIRCTLARALFYTYF